MLSLITKTLGYDHYLYITVGASGHSYIAENVVLPIEKEDIVMQTPSCKLPHRESRRLRKKFRKSPGINWFETKNSSVAGILATENSYEPCLAKNDFDLRSCQKAKHHPFSPGLVSMIHHQHQTKWHHHQVRMGIYCGFL